MAQAPVETLNESILDFSAPAIGKKTLSPASLRDDRRAQPGYSAMIAGHSRAPTVFRWLTKSAAYRCWSWQRVPALRETLNTSASPCL
jgi:hypothetical protein